MRMPSTKKAASKAFNGKNKGKSSLGCERCRGASKNKSMQRKKTKKGGY